MFCCLKHLRSEDPLITEYLASPNLTDLPTAFNSSKIPFVALHYACPVEDHSASLQRRTKLLPHRHTPIIQLKNTTKKSANMMISFYFEYLTVHAACTKYIGAAD